jgi:hypothetical protein
MESLLKTPESASQLLVILPIASPLYLSDLNKTLEAFRALRIHPELSEVRLGSQAAARLVIEGLNKSILAALESLQKTPQKAAFLLIDLKPPERPRSESFLIGSLARKIPRRELLEWLNQVPGRIALIGNQKDADTRLLVVRLADFESREGRASIRQSLSQVRAEYAPKILERVENLLNDLSPTQNWERVASTRINEPHGYRRIKEYLSAQSGFFVTEAQPEQSLVIIDLETKKAAAEPIRKAIAFEVDKDFIRLRARELLTQDVSNLLGDSRLSSRQKEFVELYRRSSGHLMARRDSHLKNIAREDFGKREWMLTQDSEGQDQDLIFLLQHPKAPAPAPATLSTPVPEITLSLAPAEPAQPAPVSIWRANSSEDYRMALREFVALQEYAEIDLLPIDELQRMAHKIPELLDSWEKFVFDLPSDLFEGIKANSEAWNATEQVDEALRTKILKLLTLIKERQEGLRREVKIVELAKQVKIFGQKAKKQPSELAIQMARLLDDHLEPHEVSIVLEHIEIHPDLMSDLGYSPGRDVAKGLANKLLTLSKGISEAGAYLTQSISFRLANVHASVKFHRFAGNHLLSIMPSDGRLLNDDPSKSFRFVVLSVQAFHRVDKNAIRERSDSVRENR